MPQEFLKYESAEQDGRIKIHPKLHPEIRTLYKSGTTQAELGRRFGCSYLQIGFIVDSEKRKKHAEERKGTWKDGYDKEKHRVKMQKYRDKKRKLGMVVKKRLSI